VSHLFVTIAHMNDADRSLAALAASQRQVFTRRQAADRGLSPSALCRRIKRGLFIPCGPHTLRFAGTTLDWRGRLMAGLLDLGPTAAVSGTAAAALHGLDGFDEGPVEFLDVRSHRGRTTNGLVTSSPLVGRLDIVAVDGLRVTSGSRTIIELLGRVGERQLANAIDSATRLGLTSPTFLRRQLQGIGRKGRPGVRTFDRIMESAGVQSWLERQFLRVISASGVPRPTVQRIYRRDGNHIARVDFDFEPLPIVVEVYRRGREAGRSYCGKRDLTCLPR
jgi:hypothetical protein